MCAINGFTYRDETLIRAMNDVTRHRGPDGSKVWSSDGISFGHNRLSIIDVTSASDQPMQSKDGRYVIVYNGELYNFKELKKELGEERFITAGDTEVILEAYVTWGKKCLEKFNGMFAFAIWDTQTKELFLARDHQGIKPLYYTINAGRLIFSSEIKGILAHSSVQRNISIENLNLYMRLLYVPEPLTMIEGIYKLPQGSYATFKDGVISIEAYFKPSFGSNTQSRRERVATIETKVDEAVERQLVSDRPLGVYLSGGIDSSVILDSMSRTHPQGKIKTYSVGFDVGPGEDPAKYNVDLNLARITAQQYNTDHHEILLSSDDALNYFEDVVWHMDEPISNPTAWALYALSKATKPTATVVLSGDGGDELFGGYERYRLAYGATWYQHVVPTFIRKILIQLSRPIARLNSSLKKLAKDTWIERYAQFMFQKEGAIERILDSKIYDPNVTNNFFELRLRSVGAEVYPQDTSPGSGTVEVPRGESSTLDFETAFLEADRKTWLTDFALMLSDTMSMAHGVEVRVPFLDRDVVEYALSIPAHDKLSLFKTKKLLKGAFAKRIPSYLLKQPKRGFFTPAAKWLRHPGFLTMSRKVLSPDYAPATRELFNWKEIDMIFEKHVDKSSYNLSLVWALLTFQIWAKKFGVTAPQGKISREKSASTSK